MRWTGIRSIAAVVVAAGLLGAGPAMGSTAGQVDSRIRAEGRGLDQATNPDYLARLAPLAVAYFDGSDLESVTFDPYRVGWAATRGRSQMVEYANRYGARIVGRLYGPPAAAGDGPFPGVVLVPGGGSRESDYEGVAQSLAESGYVVLGFDPQGQGRSDAHPRPEFCDPNGTWRQAQEAGLREQGQCAGVPPRNTIATPFDPLIEPLGDAPVAGYAAYVAAVLTTMRVDREGTFAEIDRAYESAGANYVFGALDAADFLASTANPWRTLVDTDRLIAVGHSFGAWGAVVAANGDPQRRFRAAIGFDGYGTIPPGAPPTVPTLFLVAEGLDLDFPRTELDPETGHPWLVQAARWRAAGVDMATVTLRGSTHMEWYYIPFRLLNPVAGPFFNASSEGERVSVYYLRAWADTYLRGDPTGLARMLATTFDGSADASSIGQGTFDPVSQANRPYTIAGETVLDHLSPLFRSSVHAGGEHCPDLRAGCAATADAALVRVGLEVQP